MDLDAIDILESGHLDLDDDVGDLVDGVEEQESTTPIDELKEMVKKNLSFLGTPGPVDPSPLTMVVLKEKYPQVSILVDERRELRDAPPPKKRENVGILKKTGGGVYPNPPSIFYCFLHGRPPQKKVLKCKINHIFF